MTPETEDVPRDLRDGIGPAQAAPCNPVTGAAVNGTLHYQGRCCAPVPARAPAVITMHALTTLIPSLLQVLLLAGPDAAMPTVVRPIEPGRHGIDSGIVLVRFHSGGHLGPRARGLAVTGPGDAPLAYRLLAHHPEAETVIAVDLGDAGGPAHVHYQPAPHPSARRAPDLPASLVLRTFDARSAPGGDPAALLRWLATARPLGVALVDRISFAHNPFGSSEHFITEVQGLLHVEKPGRRALFSVHDDAAVVLIDERIVIEESRPFVVTASEAIGRHATVVELGRGDHRVRYVHLQREGRSMALLGWIQKRAARPLPTTMFVRHRELTLGPARSAPDRPVTGFDARQVDRLAHDGHVLTRFRIEPIASPPPGAVYAWDFGDGTSRRQTTDDAFEHVYVSQGGREPGGGGWGVALRLVGPDERVLGRARSLVAPVTFDNIDASDNRRLRLAYVQALAEATYDKSTPESMVVLYGLAALTEQPELMAPIAQPFVERFGNRGGPLVQRMGYVVATVLSRDEPQRAAELFGRIAVRWPGGGRLRGEPAKADDPAWLSTCAAAEMLDLMIFRLDQADDVPRRVARLVAGRPPRHIALLQSMVGDVHRFRGDVARASETYHAAQRVAFRDLEPRRAAVLESAHREAALNHLERRRLPALRDVLLRWAADFPSAKLGGDLPLLTGRYFQAVGDHTRALLEFQTLLKLNARHRARPELLFRQAESLDMLGRRKAAQALREALAQQFPNSPFVAGQ